MAREIQLSGSGRRKLRGFPVTWCVPFVYRLCENSCMKGYLNQVRSSSRLEPKVTWPVVLADYEIPREAVTKNK